MFANTLSLVADCDLTFLHVFPFSPREGTPAARMPQVAPAEARARAQRLRAAGDAALQRHLARRAGSQDRVLVEGERQGRAEDYTPVALAAADLAPGTVVPVTLALAAAGLLVGQPIERLAA